MDTVWKNAIKVVIDKEWNITIENIYLGKIGGKWKSMGKNDEQIKTTKNLPIHVGKHVHYYLYTDKLYDFLMEKKKIFDANKEKLVNILLNDKLAKM